MSEIRWLLGFIDLPVHFWLAIVREINGKIIISDKFKYQMIDHICSN